MGNRQSTQVRQRNLFIYLCDAFRVQAGYTLFSDSAITATNVSAYHVNPIWVSPAEVKRTARVAPVA